MKYRPAHAFLWVELNGFVIFYGDDYTPLKYITIFLRYLIRSLQKNNQTTIGVNNKLIS